MCVRNSFDMPHAHFGPSLPWYVYTYTYEICVREALLTCLLLTLAPAYLGMYMYIYVFYVCDTCF